MTSYPENLNKNQPEGVQLSIFTGMIFFLVSDIILSIQYFGGLEKDNVMTILNHLLY